MINKGLFASTSGKWETPQHLFDILNDEFGFTLDVCATVQNAKTDNYFSLDDNGLEQDWTGNTCWMNPPYGRETGGWVKKAYEESLRGAKVICLLPARTDTKWFHDYIYGKAEIRLLKGRLKFGNAKNSAPFPSMVVVFRK